MNETLQLRQTHQDSGNEPLILCTIIEKTGSSYRDRFAKKIVFKNQMRSVGLLSGGCLEKEVEALARTRYQELPFVHSFDTMSETDRLLGYQKGCSGVISVLFEKLDSQDPVDLYFPFGTQKKAAGVEINLNPTRLGERRFVDDKSMSSAADASNTLIEEWKSPVQLTLIGCGADADPYLNLVKTLGWSLRIIDYRSDLARQDRFPKDMDFTPEHIAIDKICETLTDGPKTAVVLMTHNYESDLLIFSELLNR